MPSEVFPSQSSCRPRAHLNRFSRLYPNIWKYAEQLRFVQKLDRTSMLAQDWPSWCFIPSSIWLLILTRHLMEASPEEFAEGKPFGETYQVLGREGKYSDLKALQTLGTWRVSQGIYRFDNDVYEALLATELTGSIPCDVLFHLPEWCVYVELQSRPAFLGIEAYGFWALLDVNDSGQPSVRISLDTDVDPLSVELQLGDWSISEAVDQYRKYLHERAKSVHPDDPRVLAGDGRAGFDALKPVVESCMSLLLYLCSESADYDPNGQRPVRPKETRVKKGPPRLFPPDKPRVWDVAVRLGAALRRARAASREPAGGSHESPRPHIRKAHWHGFRSGPFKSSAGELIPAEARPFTLKWLPPIPVNVLDTDDLPATIRPVTG